MEQRGQMILLLRIQFQPGKCLNLRLYLYLCFARQATHEDIRFDPVARFVGRARAEMPERLQLQILYP